MPDVILPVLNEVGALPWVLSRIPEGYRPIVVDNGSQDGSGEVARSLGATVIDERRAGFGAACWAGLLAAEADVVCFMDCDGSLDPIHLPDIANPVIEGTYDLYLGARDAHRGAWPAHARFANRVLSADVRRRTGLALTDLGPMRTAGRTALIGLGMADRRFGWPLEMVLRAAAAGWRIGEEPVPYRARTGRSKVTGTVTGVFRTVRDMTRVTAELG